jgi:DNA-binding Lrp family transcriptional regulator
MHNSVNLDPFDLKLLAALQADAGATNAQLSDRIGLSASQISRRRQMLEETGIIQRYTALLDRERLGLSVLVFIHVTMATHSPDNAGRFRQLVLDRPEILEAYALTGDSDYVLKVVVASLKELADLVNDVLLPHQSIDRLRSEVILDVLKEGSGLPIAGV